MQQISPKLSLATLILLLCGLPSTIRIVRESPNPARVDSISRRSDQRFSALKGALPTRGVLGYVGDPEDTAGYYLTQYALAPLVIEHSPNHPLVVGNFRLSPPPAVSQNLELIKDFGGGVLLFANKDAK